MAHLLLSTDPSQGDQTQKRDIPDFISSPSTGDRPTKRRASQACHKCRNRKVKCNVISTGPPCSNCRLEGAKCIILENRRRNMTRWIKAGDGDASSSQGFHPPPQISGRPPLPLVTPEEEKLLISSQCVSSGESMDVDLPIPLPLDENLDGLIDSSNNFDIATIDDSFLVREPSTLNVSQPIPPAPTSGASYGSHFPYFLLPPPHHLNPDDVAFLERKGAFRVPETTLRNELLKSYLEFVHPSLPVLDINDFLQRIDQVAPDAGRVSLLLFHTVLFSGAAFVDEQLLLDAGYPNRKETRKELFQKCKLLYDFDYETNNMNLLQSLILMTDWYETPDEQKNTRYWMNLATSLALKLTLNHDAGNPDMNTRFGGICKRIWWSCCMRDSLISIAMRQPVFIKEEDYDVPMLTLDDFKIAALPENVSCIPMDCVLAQDVDFQRQLAEICIEKAKLCRSITHILETSYIASKNLQSSVTEEGNTVVEVMLRPKVPGPDLQQLNICHEELQKWRAELPTAAQQEFSSQNDPLVRNPVLSIHSAMLHLIFYMALSTLHHPQIPSSSHISTPHNFPDASSQQIEDSKLQVQIAAIEITQIAQSLQVKGWDRYLPTTAVTCIRPALVFHLLRIKACTGESRGTSQKGFNILLQVMNTLRTKYAAAEFTLGYLEAAVKTVLKPIQNSNGGEEEGLARRSSSQSDVFPWHFDQGLPTTYNQDDGSLPYTRTARGSTSTTGIECPGSSLPPESQSSRPSHPSTFSSTNTTARYTHGIDIDGLSFNLNFDSFLSIPYYT